MPLNGPTLEIYKLTRIPNLVPWTMVGRLLALPNAVQLLGSLFLFVAGVMVITTEMGAWSGGGGTQSPILLERVHLLKVRATHQHYCFASHRPLPSRHASPVQAGR